MQILGFIVGIGFIARLGRTKKGVDKFNKNFATGIMSLSKITVELVECFANWVVLCYKGTKYLVRIVKPVHLRRMVNIYGVKTNLTVVNKKRYKIIKAYEYYPNLLNATPKYKVK